MASSNIEVRTEQSVIASANRIIVLGVLDMLDMSFDRELPHALKNNNNVILIFYALLHSSTECANEAIFFLRALSLFCYFICYYCCILLGVLNYWQQ